MHKLTIGAAVALAFVGGLIALLWLGSGMPGNADIGGGIPTDWRR